MEGSVISESRISNGNLTVVPAKVRKATGAQAGDRLEWRLRGTEILIQVRRRKSIEDIAGMMSHGGDAVASKKAVQGVRPRVR